MHETWKGAVIQGFGAENTAVVVFLLLGDLNVLEHRGHGAAGRIMLLMSKSAAALAVGWLCKWYSGNCRHTFQGPTFFQGCLCWIWC